MEAALCSRKRPSRGAVLRPHQEAQQGHKRRTGGSKENRDPTEVLQRNRTTQRRLSQIRTRTRTRTMCWAASGFRSGAEIQSCRPEVRVALIQKTKIQNSVQDLVQLRRSNLDHKYWTEPEPNETLLDHRGPTQDRQTITTSEIRSRSRSRSGPQRPEGLISYWSTESRTRTSRSKIVLGPESCRGDGRPLKSRTRRTEARTKRRTKIHPSAFRGRGQLWLSITAEAGQLIVHIHEAKGLMGTSCRSCDSYVKVDVASEQHHKITMRTGMVSNSKNPKYRRCFTLCIRDELLLSRLLVSVFSRSPDSRRSQLIGCMSFGIASLVSSSQLLTGWFYLLGEEYGRSKHLRVTSERSGPMRSAEEKVALKADLRKTPDSTPEPDLNRINSTTEPKDPTNHCLTNGNYSSYRSTLFANSNQRHGNRDTRLTVSVIRGKDGFGFTICSDCPVRVQAVDPGGPAHQSGLHQGDSVLQLNGLPVETWKCVDLAHAIRNCSSQIVLVVWRGLPELRSCDTMLRTPTHNMMTGRKLLSHPSHSKHGHRRGQGSGVRSSLVALGSLWRDRKEVREEDQEQEATEFSPHTTTLKGTRVTSSNGDNYIILSPINSGEQVLQPVYHNRNGTIGGLYQTHPSRGQNLLHDPRTASSQRPFTSHTSTLPPPTSSSSALSSNYGNYQNCTIVQSHLPCSGYGTYVTLAPKTLIFPIFVQPLDLCSPERTLLLSEEMVLHQADLLPAKVTVLIYSDLLLLTREDEAGRCNVLQSPVYLNTLQLRDVPSEPLYIYLLQNSQSCCRLLFSLEAFSIEQKVRVSLCLHDNMPLQLVTTETGHTQQLPDLQSDFGLLSLYSPPCSPLCDATPLNPLPLYPSSSPCFRNNPPPPSSPLWKEQGGLEEEEEEEEEKEGRKRRREEEEERQQGEGESASETSEHVGGVWGRGLLLGTTHFNMKEEGSDDENDDDEDDDEEEELRCRAAGLRRSFSEGSLLQEPRSPRFLSDSTIHRLTRPLTFDPDSCSAPQPPSPRTLRSQLTREGGSLHHMLLLLNGTKADDSRNCQLRKKTKILAADVRSRLAFLRKRKSNRTSYHGNSLEKALRNTRPSAGEVLSWAESLEALLTNQYGLTVFRHFLRSEFSEENLDFWLTVEKFKKTRPFSKMAARAAKIYDEFISTSASRQVNVDSSVRELTNQSLCLGVRPTSFQLAQDQIFALMETDSYPRFLKSRFYAQLINHNTHTAS